MTPSEYGRAKVKETYYKNDLACIHDAGFGDPALRWAPVLLSLLRKKRITRGLIVDLGCGSGLLAEKLVAAGYDVLGIDSSPAFLAIARERVPSARFKARSVFQTPIPRCSAVVSTGEVFNYLFDTSNNRNGLEALFGRIYSALEPGGVLAFDLADPGQVPPGVVVRNFTEGDGWIVLVEKKEDHRSQILTRRIITFMKVGKRWRRGEEIHRQRLYKRTEVQGLLKAAGFLAHAWSGRKSPWLPGGHTAFIAEKRGLGHGA
jgi:SAM-dependent methyltransferase